MEKEISIIAAVAINKAIGKENKLLWHISEDLKYFKARTTGKIIIMGRKTFDSLPNGPLPNRHHIILTHSDKENTENCTFVKSAEEAIELCDDKKENFVIGGEAIYKMFLPLASKMYLTHVFECYDADAYFPVFNKGDWMFEKGKKHTDEKSGLIYRFDIYTKVKLESEIYE